MGRAQSLRVHMSEVVEQLGVLAGERFVPAPQRQKFVLNRRLTNADYRQPCPVQVRISSVKN